MPELELRRQDAGTITPKELGARLSELCALTLGAPEPFWFDYRLDRTPLGGSVARQVPLGTWLARLPVGMPIPVAGSLGAGF